MTVYGYARVSTDKQSLDLQIESLKEYGIPDTLIFSDKKTGKNMERESLQKLLTIVQEGDIIVVNKLDRLGRSVSQVTSLVDELTNRNIYIKSISDGVDTSNDSPMSKAMLHLLAMFSEMERNFIVERTQPALQNAKKNGVKFGRPQSNKGVYEKAVKEYVENGTPLDTLIKEYGKGNDGKFLIKEATFYRRLRDYKKEKLEQENS